MKKKRDTNAVPMFYIFGAMALAGFCIFSMLFVLGIFLEVFPINPVYLLMLVIGFLGLLATDITAIIEWRKGLGGKRHK